MPTLNEVASYASDYLHIADIQDWPNALNGLQIENSGRVTKIGAAVDISTRALTEAAEREIDFLIVHHGLFWPGLQAITDALGRQLRLTFQHDVALFSAHLPLDLHPVVGNNAQLAAALELTATEPFCEAKGQLLGLKARSALTVDELISKLEHSLGRNVKAFKSGKNGAGVVGLITGGAGSEIYSAARSGVDTFITGEAPHWAAIAAAELEVNLLLGGHYATETFGVKAMAAHLSERFDLPWEFLDCPTGL